jgi:hypothetical protein
VHFQLLCWLVLFLFIFLFVCSVILSHYAVFFFFLLYVLGDQFYYMCWFYFPLVIVLWDCHCSLGKLNFSGFVLHTAVSIREFKICLLGFLSFFHCFDG